MNKKDFVTCLYCEHHKLLYTKDTDSIFDRDKGYCKKRETEKLGNNEICEFFNIKSGFHTTKWYPNKSE